MKYKELLHCPIGTKIRAKRLAKYQTLLFSGPAFESDDIYPETIICREEEIIERVLVDRPKYLKNGKGEHPTQRVLCLNTKNGLINCLKLREFEII